MQQERLGTQLCMTTWGRNQSRSSVRRVSTTILGLIMKKKWMDVVTRLLQFFSFTRLILWFRKFSWICLSPLLLILSWTNHKLLICRLTSKILMISLSVGKSMIQMVSEKLIASILRSLLLILRKRRISAGLCHTRNVFWEILRLDVSLLLVWKYHLTKSSNISCLLMCWTVWLVSKLKQHLSRKSLVNKRKSQLNNYDCRTRWARTNLRNWSKKSLK